MAALVPSAGGADPVRADRVVAAELPDTLVTNNVQATVAHVAHHGTLPQNQEQGHGGAHVFLRVPEARVVRVVLVACVIHLLLISPDLGASFVAHILVRKHLVCQPSQLLIWLALLGFSR